MAGRRTSTRTSTTSNSGANSGGGGGGNTASYPGMFNFQGIMDSFYGMEVDKDDDSVGVG